MPNTAWDPDGTSAAATATAAAVGSNRPKSQQTGSGQFSQAYTSQVQLYTGQMSAALAHQAFMEQQRKPHPDHLQQHPEAANSTGGGMGGVDDVKITPALPEVKKSRKKHLKRLQNPRNFSKIDSIMRFLEDKRVEDASELEDLQMPRLRLVLNIVFVALGVAFLLGVIIVIIYTAIVG